MIRTLAEVDAERGRLNREATALIAARQAVSRALSHLAAVPDTGTAEGHLLRARRTLEARLDEAGAGLRDVTAAERRLLAAQ